MRALYWDGGELCLNPSYPTPVLQPKLQDSGSKIASETRPDLTALVKVHLAGICSTDLQILKGYMGFTGVPGHEFVGSVSEGPSDWIGKRVVGEINFGCGSCDYCRRDLGRHCPNRSVMGILNADGAFAEYLAVPAENLHAVPDNISDEEAVFAEPLAAAFEILTQIQLDPSDEVLVLGDGKLGNLCAQVVRLTGAKVTALGKHADKLQLIKNAGVRTIELSGWKPRVFDVVVEATGSSSGFELALSAVRPRGTVILKSTIAGTLQLSLAPIVINEINVIGSRCGPFADALEALAARRVSVTPLIEKIYSITDGVEALRQAGRTGARKILLRP
ncbi:MAG TPA: alcohol dehydrogenase catalytic domain-containing protein [Candidatus Binatia bacterium]|nr:alcohol dehydrogenase catalytic domain-containing protein [Candidatus Binatia bacterium]